MRNIMAIWRRELLAFFVSPIAYFVITGFALIGSFFFFNLLAYYNLVVAKVAQMPWGAPSIPSINQWVVEQYYQTILIFMVFFTPLLTMRVIAEERRRGTFELLVTSPISVPQIVLGKYLGVATVMTLMVLMASMFPLLLCLVSTPEVYPLLCGMLGVWVFALGFAAVGMAVSSSTENQIVAAVSSTVVLLLLYVIHAPAEALGSGVLSELLMYISPPMQVQEMIRGVLSIKAGFYFLSLITVGLFFSFRALDAHRWR
ncbi:MAG: hypothetical protein EBZ48_05615 [Proteobacteria bacterium]|nr:hypothetical protein [Pseudomonadota bacterium]